MHYLIIAIIPLDIYVLGDTEIRSYIDEVMEKYDKAYEVKPYIEKTKAELITDHQSKAPEMSFDEYVKVYCRYDLDTECNALSTYNQDALYDWYKIGGRWSGHIKTIEPINTNTNDIQKPYSNEIISVKSLHLDYKSTGESYSHVIDRPGQLQQRSKTNFWSQEFSTEENKSWNQTYEKY